MGEDFENLGLREGHISKAKYMWWPASQPTLDGFCLLISMALRDLFSHWISAVPGEQSTAQETGWGFWGQVIKRAVACTFSLHRGRSQPLCHEVAQATLKRSPQRQAGATQTSCQQPAPGRHPGEWAVSSVDPTPQSGFQMIAKLSRCFSATSWETLSQKPPKSLTPKSLTHRDYERYKELLLF